MSDLPRPLTSFIGRATALRGLEAVLDGGRTVTLVGPGGSGKTRLAVEFARRVAGRFEGGARWVDLSAVTTPDLVAAEVARALDVRAESGTGAAEALSSWLGDQRLLLVVDNCEHLVEAVADLVSQISARCPGVVVLATSREPLGVVGEVLWPVGSLNLPRVDATSIDEVVESEAVALFVDRARHVRPSFELTGDDVEVVVAICRRLDGVPLAIELAAARTQALSPTQIAESLDDRFKLLTGGPRTALPRQRTLEASVEWSYNLLSDQERLLLARLSVFVGSFDLDLIGPVCHDESIPESDVVDLVTALVNRSLLVFEAAPGGPHYRLLETIRIYARERLSELDDPSRLRDRHLDTHIAVAGRVGLALAQSFRAGLRTFDFSLDNIRAALDWAVAAHRPLPVVEILSPTFSAWIVRGLYVEVTDRLREALASPDVPVRDRARGLADVSLTALMAGQHDAAYDFAKRSVELTSEHDDRALQAQCLAYRAWSGFNSGAGTTEQIFIDLDRSVALGRETSDDLLLARLFQMSGWVEANGRSVPAGRSLLEEALASSRSNHLPYLEVPIRTFLAGCGMLDGSTSEAKSHAEGAIEQARLLGYPAFVIHAMAFLGLLYALDGDAPASMHALSEAIELAREHDLTGFGLDAQAQHALVVATQLPLAEAEPALREQPSPARGAKGAAATFRRLAMGILASRMGDTPVALDHLTATRDLCAEPMFVLPYVFSTDEQARVKAEHGDLEDAWALAHDGVERAYDAEALALVPRALETVAGIAAATRRCEVAARLLGACSTLRTERASLECAHDAAWRTHAEDNARDELGGTVFDELLADGQAQSLGDVIAYAQRGRGSRGRPSAGWESLTPAERQIVELVVTGCGNAEIAETLFVSINTVRTHLSHVYTKLGLANRTELAAEAAKRSN